MLAHQAVGGEPIWKPLKEKHSLTQNCGSQLWMILSLGDIWQFLEKMGWGLGESRDAVVGAQQPSITEHGAAQTVPALFKCSSRKATLP